MIAHLNAAFVVALIATHAAPVHAQQTAAQAVDATPSATSATYGSWTLNCVRQSVALAGKPAEPVKLCEIVQTIHTQGVAQPVAQVALGRLPGETTLRFTAMLPVNIMIPGKVALSGGEGADAKEALPLEWRRCEGSACFAENRIGAGTLAAWKAKQTALLTFDDASGRAISLHLSWNGLGQALAALDKE